MPAMRPEDCDYLVAEAINAGDVDAAVNLYEEGASFVAGPDNVVVGHDGIRAVMQGMMGDKPRLTMEVPTVVQNGDLALLFSKYSATTTAADGTETTASGNGREVVRRQADGSWRFVIDHPTAGDS
jgi:uncharacterized protein (TIGR02246 family)